MEHAGVGSKVSAATTLKMGTAVQLRVKPDGTITLGIGSELGRGSYKLVQKNDEVGCAKKSLR